MCRNTISIIGCRRKLTELDEDGFNKTVLLVTGGPARPSLLTALPGKRLWANLLVRSITIPCRTGYRELGIRGKESHFSDRFRGHSIFVSYENPHLNGSLLFGRLLGKELKDRGLQYARQYTQPIMGRHRHKLVDPDVASTDTTNL